MRRLCLSAVRPINGSVNLTPRGAGDSEMQSTTQAVQHNIATYRETTVPHQFTPLELEARPTVGTAAAAHYLHLAQQTLRIYACKENGPLRPRRINGRLHWATADLRQLLGVA